ncbi:MAG: hypothetical protein JSU86_02040 [Phycisphaerales bacterium]|nr:MAG: hypothetical protein JSU86_02040 [Phycisphaerales bacterium]
MTETDANRQDVPDPGGEFVTCVPWGRWVAILVHRARHQGHKYVRIRRWNKHRKKLCWYPTTRGFTLPAEHCEDLARALVTAAGGTPPTNPPTWLREFHEAYAEGVASGKLKPRRRRATAKGND